MSKKNQRDNFVNIKSALRNATLGAVLAGGALIPTAQAKHFDILEPTIEQRVKSVGEAIRERISDAAPIPETTPVYTEPVAENELSQWGNWGNWQNWQNWGNWQNWQNWSNWQNWQNWSNWRNY
jgi:hypothetical protein